MSAVPAAYRRASGERVPAAELVAWLHVQLRDPRRALAPHVPLARDLGISEKKLRCWLRSEDSDGNPVDAFARADEWAAPTGERCAPCRRSTPGPTIATLDQRLGCIDVQDRTAFDDRQPGQSMLEKGMREDARAGPDDELILTALSRLHAASGSDEREPVVASRDSLTVRKATAARTAGREDRGVRARRLALSRP